MPSAFPSRASHFLQEDKGEEMAVEIARFLDDV